jgi:hypothetical protein
MLSALSGMAFGYKAYRLEMYITRQRPEFWVNHDKKPKSTRGSEGLIDITLDLKYA